MAALEGVEPALREGLSGRAVDVMLVCLCVFSRVDGAALRARASTGVDGRRRAASRDRWPVCQLRRDLRV